MFVTDRHRVRGSVLLLDVIYLQNVLTRSLIKVDPCLRVVRQFTPLALRPFDLRLWFAVDTIAEDCGLTWYEEDRLISAL